jgi:hypothetical protein
MSTLWETPGFIVSVAIAVIVGVIYLRNMWLALRRAVDTRAELDAGTDQYRHSLGGAVIAVVGSASAIAAYGAGPALLYAGPVLAIASAVAVSYCLRVEYRDE